MAEYEKSDGPVPVKEPTVTDVICPACGKVKLVVKRTTGREGRNVTQHLLCPACNHSDSRVVDKATGKVVLDRGMTDRSLTGR